MVEAIKSHAPKLAASKTRPIYIRRGQRSPLEEKFGQGKTAYGINRIKAGLQQMSESLIAAIVIVLHLVKLIEQVILRVIITIVNNMISKLRTSSITLSLLEYGQLLKFNQVFYLSGRLYLRVQNSKR